ncbi:hypothetical protein IFM89_009293 [Coptis chinensis]|uniref:Cytochrome P450 n=1 Tax=Coptis chinensis TaxID=261450 RepID=A0A835IKT7_9MAGN|nr:hypothetical protein IFM89_009293 [Coptis chinensis]
MQPMVLLQLQAVCGLFALVFLRLWWRRFKKVKKIEAPELAGAWPVIGHLHLLGGPDPFYRFLGAMSDKYGPAFSIRFGRSCMLVVSGWELAKECLTTNDRILASRPHAIGAKYMGYNYAVFSLTPYGPLWREIRKIATLELLSNRQLEKLKHVRTTEVDICIKDLYKLICKSNKGVEVRPVIVEMKKWVGDKNEMQRFQKALSQCLYLFGWSAAMEAFPFLQWINYGGYKGAMKSTARDLDSVFRSWVQEHRQRKLSADVGDHEDFIDVMISSLEGMEFPGYDHDTIIKATCQAMVLGGTDTTMITLTWALSLLLNNRHVLRKAQDELDAHVGKERHVNESDIHNLFYLQAIVKETLRLYPPVPLSVPHESMEDCTIGGYRIPSGTTVIVNLWSYTETHKCGRRSCPGILFALQVLHLTLARLLHAFDLATPLDTPVDMTETVGATLSKASPLEVVLTPRLSSKLYD